MLWNRKKSKPWPWWVRAFLWVVWWAGVPDPKERAARRASVEEMMRRQSYPTD